MQNKIISEIYKKMPKFNRHLLVDYPEKKTNQVKDKLAMVFKGGLDFIDRGQGYMTYKGYKILTPEETLEYEFTSRDKDKKFVPTYRTHLELVCYMFEYKDQNGIVKDYFVYIYFPYLLDNIFLINDSRYSLMYGITEKIFTKSENGALTTRVLRQPINFFRNEKIKVISHDGSLILNEFIVYAKLHSKKLTSLKTSIPHYLVCKYGFFNILSMFKLKREDILFTNVVDPSDIDNYYFKARKTLKSKKNDISIYMRVSKKALRNKIAQKFVVNILYLLMNKNDHISAKELNDEESSDIHFKTYMGKMLYPELAKPVAFSQAKTHLSSIDNFLDIITQDKFKTFGLKVKDIWDFIYYIFLNIDNILTNFIPQNLYDKRLDIADQYMLSIYIQKLYTNIYDNKNKNKNKNDPTKLLTALNIRPEIKRISQIPNVNALNAIVNGNLAFLSFRTIDLSNLNSYNSANSPSNRAHQSKINNTSPIGFIGKNSTDAIINPYTELDAYGGITDNIIDLRIKEEIENFNSYLSY